MVEINNKNKSRVNIKLVETAVKKFLRAYKLKNKEVSIAFISGPEIKKINKKYRRINKPTDVLSFEGEDNFLGEILLNYGQIKKQAEESGRTGKEELIFILIHGLLHLIGYNDKTEKGRKEMENLGKKFISKYSL
jgi:probable rRNA maturation factor